MKTIKVVIYFFALLLMFSCQKEPQAGFTVSEKSVMAGEEVVFTNTTIDGDSYEWDFGDGTYSTFENPVHTYMKSDSYRVALKAFSKKGKHENVYRQTITVKKGNEINYNGALYSLNKAFIIKTYENIDITGYRLIIASSGIVLTDDYKLRGEGDLISMVLYTSNSTGLVSGTYAQNDSELYSSETFPVAILELGANLDLSTQPETLIKTTEGNIVITRSGSEYTIEGDLYNGASNIDLYYKGTVTEIEYLLKSIK